MKKGINGRKIYHQKRDNSESILEREDQNHSKHDKSQVKQTQLTVSISICV